jgi:tripartite ATP-independent transporter DctM subunit
VTLTPGLVAAVMFGGFALLITLRVPVSFALGIACLPIFVLDDRLTPVVLITEMAKSYNAFILLAVPFFLLAANIMNSAGITERLVAFTRTLVGHFRGGLAQINVVVSMIFAGISGSSTADAAGEGSLIIPAMRREGYDASFTVAITACSSVMGVIIPPSILMVVWGGVMSVSIGGLFLAGFLPGLLVGLSQMIAVHVYARVRSYPVYPRATVREFLRTFGNAALAIMSPVIVVGGVVGGFVTPTEAAVLAVLWSFFVGLFLYRSLAWREVPRVLYSTARLASISLFCIGTASAFGWLLAYYRIPRAVVGWLAPFATDAISAGLVIALVFLVIGCFIDAIPAIIIVGPLLAPLAQAVGMHPIHFAIIGVMSMAFGLVTPPYGLCLLIDCAIARIRVRDTLRDLLIILFPMLLALVTVILFPALILALPRLFMPQFV